MALSGGKVEDRRTADRNPPPSFVVADSLDNRTWSGGLIRDRLAFADLRELALFFVPTIYFLGYITWSINALRLNLGALPAIDQQYFVAGLFPFIVTIVVYLMYKLSSHYAELIEQALPQNIRFVHFLIRLLASLAAVAFLLGVLLFPELTIGTRRAENAVLWELAAVFTATFFCFLFPSRLKTRSDSALRLHTILLPIFIFFIGMYTSAISLSYIPSALGGLQPRCGKLDLNAEKLSPQTLAALGITDLSSGKVVRTPVTIQIIFMAGSYITLSNPNDAAYPLEIKSDSVQSIAWETCKGKF